MWVWVWVWMWMRNVAPTVSTNLGDRRNRSTPHRYILVLHCCRQRRQRAFIGELTESRNHTPPDVGVRIFRGGDERVDGGPVTQLSKG